MAHVGKIGEFVEGSENFTCYVERMEQYFAANDITDKKVAVFLAVMGPQTYSLLRNIMTPDLPSTKTYDEIVTALKGHFMPKPLVIAERFKFHNRSQKEGESVADYVVGLKKLAAHCEFGNFLSQALRDRLVCGLRSEFIQKKLLAEKDLTLEKACEISVAMETAARNTTEMKPGHVPGQVNKVFKGPRQQKRDFNKKPRAGESKSTTDNANIKKPCYRCGGKHSADVCTFKDARCYACSKTGHLAKMCLSKKKTVKAKYLQEVEGACSDRDLGMFGIVQASTARGSTAGYQVHMELDGNCVKMELDTGAAVSIVSEELYKNCLTNLPLQPTSVQLKTYSGDKVELLGKVDVPVRYGNQHVTLPLIIARGDKPSLLGRNWLKTIKLDWKEVFRVHSVSKEPTSRPSVGVEELKSKYSHLFQKDVGTIKHFKAHIHIDPSAKPIFCKARPVPFALRESLEKELDRLESQGIISKVDRSDWATPIVIVPKTDKSIRLCGDFKVTVNQCLDEQQYPLPNVDDMFAQLAGGEQFTKLDLSQAYQQLLLNSDSEQYLTINTHLGLYRYHRLPFGVSSAPAIFQAVMDQILQGLDNVLCRIDDILITAPTKVKHLATLEEVLKRLDHHNIRLRTDKCKFMEDEVEYMGHMINREGSHPTTAKVEAIREAPSPTNVTELKSFLGLLNYYGSYLPSLSTTLQPMHELLQKKQSWKWTSECETAFRKCKERLSENTVLVHYDGNKPLKLACDASAYGLGAVISHIMDNGEERPIAFASRTLAPSEKNYAQIEKEALALIFGVKKFHKYLYGRRFTLVTDHKPLTTILGPKTGVPTLAAARMQRWALILSAYQYDIVYRKAAEHGNADAFSRLPVQGKIEPEEAAIFKFSHADELPVEAEDISRATRKDPILSRVLDYVLSGWPNHVTDTELQPYFQRREQLSTEQGCILWGLRIIIPPAYRERLLADLHDQHIGICRMKALARSYLWWPGLDQEIEQQVSACSVCQSVRNLPATAPLHSWSWPTRVWQRLHIDFAEKDQQYFLVLIDSHSKWLECVDMSTTTSTKTIEVLRSLFASYGLPEEIVSDNGPQFISSEFEMFLRQNGVKHTLVAPYHPASNGAAERSVQILKRTLLKQVLDGDKSLSIKHRLANFLITYRATPHTVTGVSPAELFLKRQMRTKLTLLKPNLGKRVSLQQAFQKKHHDKGRVRVRTFSRNQSVRVRNFRGGKEKWIVGSVVKQLGPLTYLIRVGRTFRYVHVDHILATGEENVEPFQHDDQQIVSCPTTIPIEENPIASDLPDIKIEDKPMVNVSPSTPKVIAEPSEIALTPARTSVATPQPERRYPARERRAPHKLDL
ncbi:uncharacterized protein K02A2.6-like [Mizuhopecten yessoensis]|uniref:uncharacterized protein K02A2.6-like n=1 Tax=Mizuhopecten yessoensis TaxID=6573 RepID=UPI000B458525|nr:uncharacterized protein K02A2.6-like [Mizuhopecten yessoensis]XP_021354870.1 uncharacterized protein K02A2.6-like [Mizuhopecten yessoensis]XP_021366506.1 uncharacterized protein K02A2.6-like [Mizuhopecten yessoensis]